jgi:hypothetical protein
VQLLRTKSPFLNESPSAPPAGAKRKEKGGGEKLFQRKYSLLNESPAARKRRGIHIEKGLPLDNVDSSMKAHPLVRGEKRKKAMLHPR